MKPSGKHVSQTQSDRGFRVKFLSSITTSKDASFTCMAVHPIHPLVAVCDDSQNIFLHRINADQPHLIHLPLFHLGQYVHASCIAFHSTLPLVAASSDETNLITFWNIQEVIDSVDEDPFNVEERRRELKQLIQRDASQIEEELDELDELDELEELDNYAGITLKSFTTVTTVKPSYITFHPTMPYIVVGCVNFETNSSVIQTFRVEPPVEEVSSIIIPIIGEETPYKKIESIAFSPDGVFLAATFGQKIIVWFFSPTKEMKILIDLPIDNTYFKSLVFSPRDFSPRDYTLIVGFKSEVYKNDRFFSLKIEKDIHQAAPILTTLEGWTITLVSNHTVKTPISTLAFHPMLPLLVGGFVNGDVKYYVFDREGDNISELTKLGFTNSIPFDVSRPSVALNRQFLVTCGSNKVDIYAMDGVESAVKRFEDTARAMSVAARASLALKGMPEGVRALILNKTSYGNSVKGSIAFLKMNVGKKGFLDRPLWLLGIMQQFIDLLKRTPNLPPILFPFEEIITNYYPSVFTNAEYRQTCNEIVERFITENKLDPKRAVVKKIKDFFNSVVDELVTHRVNLRKDIQTTFIEEIFPILQKLFTLNQSEPNHRVIGDIDLTEVLEYEKAERAFTRKHREAHQGGRKKKTRARTYKKNKTRARRGVY